MSSTGPLNTSTGILSCNPTAYACSIQVYKHAFSLIKFSAYFWLRFANICIGTYIQESIKPHSTRVQYCNFDLWIVQKCKIFKCQNHKHLPPNISMSRTWSDDRSNVEKVFSVFWKHQDANFMYYYQTYHLVEIWIVLKTL